MNRLLNFDAALSQQFTLSPESYWQQLACFVAHLGDGPYVFGGLGIVYLFGWFLEADHLRQNILVIGFIVSTAIVIVILIKFIIRRQRPRPPGEFVSFQYDVYSFPSGHSARLAALAVSFLFFYPLLGWGLAIVALSVAAARVAIGIHYVSDIIVGLGVGILVAWGSVALVFYLSS